ncbi:hypothetical protein [Hymenobacter norwichensis]|uniref:hypothetical protein n=1 Tax=Hymenobacter norwichensis TaxID=223903 RepID=UPI0003B317AF|nr:hypothetical protein [Hymenobacter norwichensis]
MNFDFAEVVNPFLEKADFNQAIQLAEARLVAIPTSPFHLILGKSLLNQAESLCLWVDSFYEKATRSIVVKSLYFELTEFDINTDKWEIEGFTYAEDGGLDDQEWLADFSQTISTDEAFVLVGYESLQEAFEEIALDSDDLQDAHDWCEQLVLARYRQLVYTAHQQAVERQLSWAHIPVYCAEHGYNIITKSVV